MLHPLTQPAMALGYMAVNIIILCILWDTPCLGIVHASCCYSKTIQFPIGNTSILSLSTFLKVNECESMVIKLVSLKDCSCKHLKFVLIKTSKYGSGIAPALKCSLSELKTALLFEKRDIDVPTLEAVVKLGATLTSKSIEKAVKYIKDDNLPTLEYALSSCNPKLEGEALTPLCTQALGLNKPLISDFLIKQGAKPACDSVIKAVDTKTPQEGLVSYLLSTPYGCVCLFIHAISQSALTLAEKSLEGSTIIFPEVIDLGDFLKSSKNLLCNNLELLGKLLKTGVKPDGLTNSNRPIDAVLALPKDFKNKVNLVCILIDYGADLIKATYPRGQGTTIFHIATQIAFDQGE